MNSKKFAYITRPCAGYLVLSIAFLLAGCQTPPKAYHLDPVLKTKMATDDAEEIHRRWGDFSYLIGKHWIGNDGSMTNLASMAWEVKGASATSTYWSCERDACYLTERLMQYNPEKKILDVLLETVNPRHEDFRYMKSGTYTVQPDGTVKGNFLSADWKYDRSEKMFYADKVKFYELDEQKYKVTVEKLLAATREAQRQKSESSSAFWSNMSTGMAALSKATAQTAQDYRAQQARSDSLNQSIQNSRNNDAARERERIANDQAQLKSKQQQQMQQQQAAPMQASAQATAGNQQAALQAKAAQREAEARAKAATSDAERQKRLAEQERQAQVNAQQQSRQSSASTTSSNTAAADYWAARRAGIDHPDSGKSEPSKQGTTSLGRAGAWCTKTKHGGFVCTGPLQKITMSEPTLEAALGRVGCANGQGYSPVVGQGSYFDCGRELKSYDEKVPTYDPYYNSSQ